MTNLSGIHTRALKKRKIEAGKASPSALETQDVSHPPPGSSDPDSLKNMKTLMGDPVSHADWIVTALMQDSGIYNSSHNANLSTEFKF